MAISAKDVMALRKATGLGMMESKAALEEAGGDMEKATNLLRTKGLAKMDARANRESAEGRVAAAVAEDHTRAALVMVNAETDFTANNQAFVGMTQKLADQALTGELGEVRTTDEMVAAVDEVRITTKENVRFAQGVVLGGEGRKVGAYVHHTGKIGVLVEADVSGGEAPDELLRDLAMHISAAHPTPLGVSEDQVPAEVVEKEKEIAKQQAIDSGKPEEIAEKMVTGKIRKFLDTVVLLRQPFVKDEDKKIADLLPDGVSITAFTRYQVG